MKLTKDVLKESLENALSWLVTLMLVFYGFGKVLQFEGSAQLEKMLPELTGMELMWAFYGYSLPYVLIIGALEVLSGILIAIKKTRIVGCLLATTILVNIILQDIFYEVLTGAFIAAVFYQLCILIILFFNRKKLVESVKHLLIPKHTVKNSKYSLLKWGLSSVFFILVYCLAYVLTH